MTAVEVERPRCVAHSSRTGERCKRSPIAGGTVCASHGGRAPQVKRAAARRLEAQRVESELGKLLVDLEQDATDVSAEEVLIDAVRRAHAMVAVLGLVVGRLGDLDSLVAEDHLDDLRQRPEVAMYLQWTGEAARLSKLAIDAGVERRQLEWTEREVRRGTEILVTAIQLLRAELLDAVGENEHRVITAGALRSMMSERTIANLVVGVLTKAVPVEATAQELEP